MPDNNFTAEIENFNFAIHDFDSMEKSISSGLIGFGNPRSKLTAHEQFLHWKEQTKQTGQFPDRDVFCNTMAAY